MPRMLSDRIAASSVAALQPGDTLRDVEIKGFGVRRRAGAPSYFLQTRIKGRLRWITIGTHGSPWTPASARKEALRLLTEINDGSDPGAVKTAVRRAPIFADAAEQFLLVHGPKLKPTTQGDYRRILDATLIPAFGKRQIGDISVEDVEALHVGLADTPRKANYALAVLAKFLSWAKVQPNPCRDIKKFRENQRQRFLSDAELTRLGTTLAALESTGGEELRFIQAIRLLLLTGCRLSEILTLKWQYVDLQRCLLLLPDSKTGQKAVYVNDNARTLLAAIPRQPDNPYVIAGNRPSSHLVNLQKAWRRIRAQAALDDVRLHDLRHSYASVAAANGASLLVIGRLLGHASPRTTQRYAHLVSDQIKDFNEVVGANIGKTMARRDTE
jgi:integrase